MHASVAETAGLLHVDELESLMDAVQSCVVVMVSIWCGVGLLHLFLHCECLEGLPLLLDLLELLPSLNLFFLR